MTKTETAEQRSDLLHSVFTTALEGGIGYWSVCSKYHWSNWDSKIGDHVGDVDGFFAIIESNNEDGWGHGDLPAEVRIDKAVMDRGLERFQEWMTTDKRNTLGGLVQPESDRAWRRDPHRPDNRYWQNFCTAVMFGRWDEVDYDADLADTIVQLGLFNEVVYS